MNEDTQSCPMTSYCDCADPLDAVTSVRVGTAALTEFKIYPKAPERPDLVLVYPGKPDPQVTTQKYIR